MLIIDGIERVSIPDDDVTLYNNISGLRNWRKSKADQDAYLTGRGGNPGVCNINFIGGSITEGYAGGTISISNYERGLSKIVRDKILTTYSDTGAGFIPCRYPYTAATPAWIQGGDWVNFGPFVNGWAYFSNGSGVLISNTADNTLTVNFDGASHFNGTGLVLLVEERTDGGDFTVSIDSGAVQTFTNYAATTALKAISSTTSDGSTPLSAANHTCTITTINTNRISIMGGYELKGDHGFRVNTVAASGGHVSGIAHSAVTLSAAFDYWEPKLSIIELIGNDFSAQTSLEDFATYWQTVITQAKLYGDVLITTIGGIYNLSKTVPIKSYIDTLFSLAMANNCAFLDVSKAFGGNFTDANASGYLVDNVHYSVAGHQAAANLILRSIEI